MSFLKFLNAHKEGAIGFFLFFSFPFCFRSKPGNAQCCSAAALPPPFLLQTRVPIHRSHSPSLGQPSSSHFSPISCSTTLIGDRLLFVKATIVKISLPSFRFEFRTLFPYHRSRHANHFSHSHFIFHFWQDFELKFWGFLKKRDPSCSLTLKGYFG